MKTRRGFAFLMMATALTGVPGAAQSNSSSAAGTCSRSNTPSHQLKLESSEKTIRDEMALALHRMQQNTLTREERRSMAELIRPETGQSGELDRVLRQLREPTLPEAELSRRLELEHQRWTAIPAMADDRITQTTRASTSDGFETYLSPIGLQVALRCGR